MARIVVELKPDEEKQVKAICTEKGMTASNIVRKVFRLPLQRAGRPAKKAAKHG